MAAKPIIFCPHCDLLILNESVCSNCGWQRPLSGSAPGTVLWQTSLESKLGEPYSTLAVTQGLLLVSLEVGQQYNTPQGVVVALDTTTGQEQWRYFLPEGRITRTLVANEEIMWIGSEDVNPLGKPDNVLVALNLKGEIAWQYPVPAHSLSAPAILKELLFFTTNARVGYILEAQNGRLHHQIYHLPTWISAAPTVGDDTFYIGSRESVIQVIEVKDGRTFPLFQAEQDEHRFAMPPIYHQGTIYAPCWDKHLYAIDTSTHQLRWRVPLGRGISSPPVVGTHLYVGVKDTAEDKKPAYALYALNLETGETVWRFQVDKHIEAPALVVNGFVFVGSKNGRFYALDAFTGTVQWMVETSGRIITTPLATDTMLFFGTREGQITAVSWPSQKKLFSPAAYRAEGDWEMAGITSALAGDFAAAAADFAQLLRPYHAAQLYAHAAQTPEEHLVTAQTFQQAAEWYEQTGQKQSVQLWEAAFTHYEQAYEPEMVAQCQQQINRLRRWPELDVQIMAEHPLEAGTWGNLTLKIVNSGHGPAKTISVRVVSPRFEGNDLDTKKIPGLREGKDLVLSLRVRPSVEVVGQAVPLDFEVTYLRPDNQTVTQKLQHQVLVRRLATGLKATAQILNEEQTKLHTLLIGHFNEGELRTLCFKLGVEYEDLPPGGRSDKARELITYMERHGRLQALISACQETRPLVSWTG